MKLLISVIFLVLVNAQLREPKEIGRRQFVSYVNNVVHENPKYPDQTAQSSVKVNFNTPTTFPQQYQDKTVFPQQYQPEKTGFPQQYQKEKSIFPQQFQRPSQSQLFNVGYSVKFTNDKPTKPKYPRKTSLDDGEIITGTRKQNEQVEVPAINMSPQEYVSHALLSKQQKISGIKPKQQPQYITYPNPKTLLNQANLSPTTQKHFKALEQLKPQLPNTQELHQKYTWKHLSPGVEIIRSTEVPAQKFPKTFDHARALGRSQEFDQSNALDTNQQQQPIYFYQQQSQQIPVASSNLDKIPIDTSLLREPLSIQVDTRLVEEAMRNQNLFKPKYTPEINYLQQNYRTLPVDESQPKPVFFQQQGSEEYEPEQNRFQVKIYGKPQPLSFGGEEAVKRQPRFVLDRNLRPPRLAMPFQRRFIMY